MKKIMIWIKAARLKLHILGMLPVLVGSLIAFNNTGYLKIPNLIFAELIALFVLITTAFANDYADTETDSLNKNYNAFSGGSRLIPSGLLSKKQMMTATLIASLASIAFSLVFLVFLRGHPGILILNLFGLFIGIEYSLPPLRINYRGLGELFVMFMYSIFCLFFGYVAQTGPGYNVDIFYFSILLAISMLLMILITEVPDTESDKISGKKTIPTLLGKETSFLFYSSCVAALYATIVILYITGVINKFTFSCLFLSLPLGICLLILSLSRKKLTQKKISVLCGITLILNIWVNVTLTLNLALSL